MLTTHELSAGYNALWAGTALLFFSYAAWRLWANGDLSAETKVFLVGTLLMALNEWSHRLYWLFAQWDAPGAALYAEWADPLRGWLLLSVLAGVIGKWMILPVLDLRYRRPVIQGAMLLVAVGLFVAGVRFS